MLRFAMGLTYTVVAFCGQVPVAFSHDSVSHAFQSKVMTLLREQLSDVAGKQIVSRIYDVPAGTAVPRHLHAGDVFHFVLEGQWAAEVEDRETRLLKQGDSQFVSREKWHGGKVVGDHPLKLLAVMVIDTDKPVSTMVDPH